MVPRKNDECIECKNVLNWKTAGLPVSSSSSCTFHVDGYRMGSPIHWEHRIEHFDIFHNNYGTFQKTHDLTLNGGWALPCIPVVYGA